MANSFWGRMKLGQKHMTRFEGIGAFESSFHPPSESLCELIRVRMSPLHRPPAQQERRATFGPPLTNVSDRQPVPARPRRRRTEPGANSEGVQSPRRPHSLRERNGSPTPRRWADPHAQLIWLSADFFAGTLSCQSLLQSPLLARLQVVGMTLHLLNDIFRLNLALKPTQGILQRFALLQSNFCQTHHLQSRINCNTRAYPICAALP